MLCFFFKQKTEYDVRIRDWSSDVCSSDLDNPNLEQMRAKFLDEHFHKEDEVRFFVAGSGLFTLHVGDKVYEILCEAGDLVSVPDGTTHWFDMGQIGRASCRERGCQYV